MSRDGDHTTSTLSSFSNSIDTMPMTPLKTARLAVRTARNAGKVIKLGLRIQRARPCRSGHLVRRV